MIVENYGITVVVCLADTAEPLPQHVRRKRPAAWHDRASSLVINRKDQVDYLHVVIRAHVAVGVRRYDSEAQHRCVVVVAQALEVARKRGCGTCPWRGTGVDLTDRVLKAGRWCEPVSEINRNPETNLSVGNCPVRRPRNQIPQW